MTELSRSGQILGYVEKLVEDAEQGRQEVRGAEPHEHYEPSNQLVVVYCNHEEHVQEILDYSEGTQSRKISASTNSFRRNF